MEQYCIIFIDSAEVEAIPSEAGKETGDKKKKRVVEAPKAQSLFHCEYNLLPDGKGFYKADIVTYGMIAKIYLEGSDTRVVRTWNNAGLCWVAWQQS